MRNYRLPFFAAAALFLSGAATAPAAAPVAPPTEILDVRDAPIRLVFEMMLGTNVSLTDDIQGNTTFRLTGKAIREEDKMPEPYRTNGGDYPPILGWLKEVDKDLVPGRLLVGFEREGGAYYVSLKESKTTAAVSTVSPPPAPFSTRRVAAIHWFAANKKFKYPDSLVAARRAIWITQGAKTTDAQVVRVGDRVPIGWPAGINEREKVIAIEPTRVIFATSNGKAVAVALTGFKKP